MKKTILDIQDLTVEIENRVLLKNIHLRVNENEIHAILGPNGSGKSTLSKVIAGHPKYRVVNGSLHYLGKNLQDISPEERSHLGIFLAFQNPLEISGVTNFDFLKNASNQKQKFLQQPEWDPLVFFRKIQESTDLLKFESDFLQRNLNEGFSGGEKKKNEILQALVLEPKLIILDEIDSGLDVDALRIICQNLLPFVSKGSALIIITHYPKILEYLQPNVVHILKEGRIVTSGDNRLIHIIEKEGFESL
jgi:Fe-S cluster assembly ATP-binding protein